MRLPLRRDARSASCHHRPMASSVIAHYGRDDHLAEHLRRDFERAGFEFEGLSADDLAGVDEFHLGGRAATEALLDDLALGPGSKVLDVGCGIGGAVRTTARRFGCTVAGVDLTPYFVAAATVLSAAVGLSELTTFVEADALDLPFPERHFDAVTVLHVGMNIADKDALAAQLARVVRPGGVVAVYDIMRVGDGEITYPVPWASAPSTSFPAAPEDYRAALVRAGLEPGDAVDRLGLVRDALHAAAERPPPVNLANLMGDDWTTMFGNLRAAVDRGVVSPTQILAHRPAE